MKQILGTSNGVIVANTPSPVVGPGDVLVRTVYSLVSMGTELAPIQPGSGDPNEEISTATRVRAQTKLAFTNFRLVLKYPHRAVRKIGRMTRDAVIKKIGNAEIKNGVLPPHLDVDDQGWNMGYSCSGRVEAVGDKVTDFAAGDFVACAGAGRANHAEFVSVPSNLVCKVPAGVEPKVAAMTTVGAIALQGVRRAAPGLGETVAVIGLGLIGQITAQLLQANGCRVLGFDIDERRVAQAGEFCGIEGTSDQNRFCDLVNERTGGMGADSTLITAATSSNDPANLAMLVSRRKGVVVLVGDVGLGLERVEFYRKELDLRMSTSYGPGRYDPQYEEQGNDYPLAYVRWSAGRNMQAFLDLAAQGRLNLAALIDREIDLAAASQAYGELVDGGVGKPLGAVIRYPEAGEGLDRQAITLSGHRTAPSESLGWALVGAGAFGISTLTPALEKLGKRVHCRAVVSSDAVRGGNFARQNKIETLASDLDEILDNQDINLLVIATRHVKHAEQAMRGIKAGKHVFVEKPLATTWEQLDRLISVVEDVDSRPALMVGFNRRFAPSTIALKKELQGRRGPVVITYRVNAGSIPLDHWTQGEEGGGRNIGEACHMYDLFRHLTGESVKTVTAHAVDGGEQPHLRSENFVASMEYADGSLATLIYSSLGPKQGLAKERLEVLVDGEAYVLDDFRQLTRASDGAVLWQGQQNKGHEEELKLFTDALLSGDGQPIPFEEIVETTALALSIEDMLYGRQVAV